MRDATLIISATYDDSNFDWFERLGPHPKLRVSTAAGGHPTGALISTYRFQPKVDAYLLLQDSLEPTVQDVVAPFKEKARKARTPVVGWARFPLFFDDAEQKAQVERQYPYVLQPEYGIFGPIFWVERKVMDTLSNIGRFPKLPANKMEAQGTERAWAYAFAALGIKPAFLHDWSNEFLASGDAAPFRKIFSGRQ